MSPKSAWNHKHISQRHDVGNAPISTVMKDRIQWPSLTELSVLVYLHVLISYMTSSALCKAGGEDEMVG